MKARPTHYKGVEYKSRLESMWAKEFDKRGLDFKYEPFSFNMPDEHIYTPDFMIKGAKTVMWFEIKPTLEKFDIKCKKRIWSFIKNFNVTAANLSMDYFALIVGQPDSFDMFTLYPLVTLKGEIIDPITNKLLRNALFDKEVEVSIPLLEQMVKISDENLSLTEEIMKLHTEIHKLKIRLIHIERNNDIKNNFN